LPIGAGREYCQIRQDDIVRISGERQMKRATLTAFQF
jgi:hypothetical protein